MSQVPVLEKVGPQHLELRHPRGRTRITVGCGAFAEALPALAEWVAGRRLFVLSTGGVRELHGAALAPLCSAAASTVDLEVPEGEAAKAIGQAERLWREMAAAGGKRDSRLVAFGGGSVGDLGGFVSGCFLRGIEFSQLPTTLLAQADASIGGKTAVDLPEAKNFVGLFHHPRFVVSDARWLASLPLEELRSGLVETIKMGVLGDRELFDRIEATIDRLLAGDPEALAPVVVAAARGKIEIVEADPEEGGRRRLLNLGHTLGHALEAAAAYSDLRHGEAVAYGLLFVLRLAVRRGLPVAEAERVRALVLRLGLPPLPFLGIQALFELMSRDKKAIEAGLRWVLPRQIGEADEAVAIPLPEIEEELRRFLAGPLGPVQESAGGRAGPDL